MDTQEHAVQVARDTVLNMLSEAEVAKVSNSENTDTLHAEKELVDLRHLDLGVQPAKAATRGLGVVVLRRKVSNRTWEKILG